MAKELGVSRVPVREALLQLEGDGLIEIEPHKGAIVSRLTEEDAIDLFETRKVVELLLLKCACKSATPEEIAYAREQLLKYEKVVEEGGSTIELNRLNWKFHIALLTPSHRPRSVALIKSFYNSMDRYVRLQINTDEARANALKDHLAILEAYESKNTKKVVKLMTEHIDNAFEGVQEALVKLL